MGTLGREIYRLRHRPPAKSDLLPELPKDTPPTQLDRAKVLREAVSTYIRDELRAPDVREICEEFIAAVDAAARENVPPPVDPPPDETLPDVPEVSITPAVATAPSAGGSGSVAVTITAPGTSGTWTVERDAAATWLTYTPLTPQSADGMVNWTAAPNSGEARTADLLINGQTFTLDQDAAPASSAVVSLSPDVTPVIAAGGSGTLTVTITTAGTWVVEADPTAPWLTYTPTAPQSADGPVNWTAAANGTGQARQAILHINGEPFTVNQSAA